MEFNRIAIIIILITSSITLFVSIAYGQSEHPYNMVERAEKANQEGSKQITRIGDMMVKCGDYMIEKAEAGLDPSPLVTTACLEIVEGFNNMMSNFLTQHQTQIEIIE